MSGRARHPRTTHSWSNAHELMESLEQRTLMTGFSWTAQEVYLAELVNRARANPTAEGIRLGIDLTQGLTQQEIARLVPQEPLALDPSLTTAARAYSLDMANRDFFDHVDPDGHDPTWRAQNAGYNGTAGENIAAGYNSVDEAHLAWMQSVGHRRNVLSLHSTFDDTFHYDEFGPGIANTQIGPFFNYYTQEFGVQASPVQQFVLGVIFNDTDHNNFYGVGEGMTNIRVDVAPQSQPLTIIATYQTDAAGNYQLAIPAGSYIITFTDNATGASKVAQFTMSTVNVKIDALATEFIDTTFRRADSQRILPTASGSGRIAAGTINQHGDSIVVQQNANGSGWTGFNLSSLTGAPDVIGQVVTWVDTKDNLFYAAGATGSGVVLFRQSANGNWTFRNLTTETSGMNVPGGQLVVLPGTDGIIRLAGVAGNGDLVLYSQTGAGSAGAYVWNFRDLATQDLVPGGYTMPQFSGEIVGYVTSWNGLNVAGLDSQGQIHTVWWAPGIDLWRETNLSAITGAPAYSGGLTVYLTSWDGINVAGLLSDGSLSVTWWVPSFGGNWNNNNLTSETGGPTFQADSTTTYVTAWGGLNIAGLNNAGDVIVYWWAPANTQVGWQIVNLSDQIAGAPLPQGQITGYATSTGVLNIFGADSRGNLFRYHWQVGGQWSNEDLTVAVGGPG